MRSFVLVAAALIVAGCSDGREVTPVGTPGPSATPTPGQQQSSLAPALCGTAPGAASSAGGALRIANLNVLHGLDETPEYPAHSTLDARLELQTDELASVLPDVVGMQEVSFTEAKASTQHAPGLVVERLATELAERTGLAWHWCWYLANPHFPLELELRPGGGGGLSDVLATVAASQYASFKEGIAVLSRWPIVASEGRRLPNRLPIEHVFCPPELEVPPTCIATVAIESRVALWTLIDTPGGRTGLVTTHLAHDLTDVSDLSTFVQAGAVLLFEEEKSAAASPARRFLTCDCNTKEEDEVPVLALITDAGWRDTFRTVHADAPGSTSDQDILAAESTVTERIDYVFARDGMCPVELLESATIANEPGAMQPTSTGFLWPSDHHGVATDVPVACAAP